MPFTTRGAALQRMWLYEDSHLTHIWSWAKDFPSFSHSHERASSLSGCLTDLCKIRNRARKKLLPQLMYSAGKARPHWKIVVSILVRLNGACRAQGLLGTTRSVTRMPWGTPGQGGNRRKVGQEALCLSAHFSWTATTRGWMHLHGTRHEHLLPCTTRFLPALTGKILAVAKPVLITLCRYGFKSLWTAPLQLML